MQGRKKCLILYMHYNWLCSIDSSNYVYKFYQVIYVARNIKDATVSHYHHKKLTNGCTDFKAFAECTRKDEVEYNPFIPHILEAWRQRDHPNLYFTTYEEMKKDLRRVATDVLMFLKGKGQKLNRRYIL